MADTKVDIGLAGTADAIDAVLAKKKKKQTEGAGAAEAYVPNFDMASWAAGMKVDSSGSSSGSNLGLLKLLFGV